MVKLDPTNLSVAYNLISLQEELMTNRQKIQAYRELLAIAPDFTEAALNLGIAYYREGRHEESKSMFDGILKHQAESGIAYYNRGLTRLKLKDPAGAERDFKKGLQFLGTDHAPSYGALGIAFTELQRFGAAIEALELAVSLDPKNPIYAFNLAHAFYKNGAKNRACFYFQKAADLGQKEALTMLSKICE
jgi:tetratricopeptide (TPR) repeat protein